MAKEQEQRLEQLKQKYQSVLNLIQQQQVHLQNVHMQNDKLFIRGEAPSPEVKNRIWDQIKLIDPTYSDLTADITVVQQGQSATAQPQAAGASASGGESTRTYIVEPGDSLSKISGRFYGDPNQYMKIFNANRDKLSDPDKVRAGTELVIPR